MTQHPDNAPSTPSRDNKPLSRDTPSGPGSGDERKLEDKIGDNIDLFKSVFADSDSEVGNLAIKISPITIFTTVLKFPI